MQVTVNPQQGEVIVAGRNSLVMQWLKRGGDADETLEGIPWQAKRALFCVGLLIASPFHFTIHRKRRKPDRRPFWVAPCRIDLAGNAAEPEEGGEVGREQSRALIGVGEHVDSQRVVVKCVSERQSGQLKLVRVDWRDRCPGGESRCHHERASCYSTSTTSAPSSRRSSKNDG